MTYTVANYRKILAKAKASQDEATFKSTMEHANQLEKGLINMGRGAAVQEVKEQLGFC